MENAAADTARNDNGPARNDNGPALKERQAWMGLIAKALTERLLELAGECMEKIAATEDGPTFSTLRAPETGLVMVRARAGGSGSPFNMGEMTATRCSVLLERESGSPIAGHAYVAGRRPAHAEAAAKLDALLQDPRHAATVRYAVLDPLAAEQAERTDTRRRKVGATRVDFFTMVRGED